MTTLPPSSPESLNLWDRIFNRYRKHVLTRGHDRRSYYCNGVHIPGSDHIAAYVDYAVIDRLTGSTTIKREYL